MNIYQHELKTSIKSVVIWSIAIAAIILIYMAMFSSIASDAALMNEMMAKFPKDLKIAFGIEDMDFSTVRGYFGFIFLFCQICLAIQAANYGFSLVSIEERELTADFLLAKPVGRKQILTDKLLSAVSGMTITNIMVWISAFLFITLFRNGKDYPAWPIVLVLLSIVLFQMVFFSVGLLISLLVKRVRAVTPYSMGLVFGLYLLNAFGNMIGEDSLEIITPFKHFDPNYILKNSAYNPLVLISVGVSIVSIIASYVLYSRRNISAPV